MRPRTPHLLFALPVACAAVLFAPALFADETASREGRAAFSGAAIEVQSLRGEAAPAGVPEIKSVAPAGFSLDLDLGRGIRRGRRGGWTPPGHQQPFPGYPYPDRGRPHPGSRAYSCSATDRGWEEHWGGHHGDSYDLSASRDSACRSCKSPSGPHGSCDVRCGVPEFQCAAEFVPNSSSERGTEVRGYPRETPYDAEDSAMNLCMRENWGRDGRCRIRGCDRQDRIILSESCR